MNQTNFLQLLNILVLTVLPSGPVLAQNAPSADTPALRPAKMIEQTVKRNIEITTPATAPPAADITLPTQLRIDRGEAKRLARVHWLDKAVQANPILVDSITQYKSAAKLLACHNRLGSIAAGDHYLCRRLTRWKGAARACPKWRRKNSDRLRSAGHLYSDPT